MLLMPRNPHPRSVEELERDVAVYGSASPDEEHRMLAGLGKDALLSAMDHIADSQALLEAIDAKFPGRQTG